MKIHHSTGSICLKGPLGLIYNVARIDYYLQENVREIDFINESIQKDKVKQTKNTIQSLKMNISSHQIILSLNYCQMITFKAFQV